MAARVTQEPYRSCGMGSGQCGTAVLKCTGLKRPRLSSATPRALFIGVTSSQDLLPGRGPGTLGLGTLWKSLAGTAPSLGF